jgi:serine phosphatase RsbU (regulator of sigma subunit)
VVLWRGNWCNARNAPSCWRFPPGPQRDSRKAKTVPWFNARSEEAFGAIIKSMSSTVSAFQAHRCSFHPDRRDPYLRLSTITVYVRDLDRSLRFYLDQLGFCLAFDTRLPTGERWLAVSPPDGTAIVEIVAPTPEADEYKLIGRSTGASFLTDDVFAKFDEWRGRGVRFFHPPRTCASGAVSTTFEDVDGNSFTLTRFEGMTRELEVLRRAHVERLEQERRDAQELEFARQVQARLLPQRQPCLETLEYAGLCVQAHHVGGDYYDFLDLGRQRLGLVVADISGKGTAAALLMANLQAHLRNQCATYWSRPFTPFALDQPQRFLVSVNRLFCENASDNAYATLFFAEYDDQLGRLRYANCGHPSPLLLRNGHELERLDSTCGVVGLFKQWDCTVGERYLGAGDTLVIYSDGMTESFNDAGEEFGEPRLIEALQRHHERPPQELLASLAEDVQNFSSHERHDDVTLVVARRRPR